MLTRVMSFTTQFGKVINNNINQTLTTMKTKYLWILLLTVSFLSCNDDTGSLGLSMLPPSDILNVGSEKFNFQTSSVTVDHVYAKTSVGYVGRFTDPEFGYYETSFLSQLNCTDNFTFPEIYDPGMDYPALTEEEADDGVVRILMSAPKIKSSTIRLGYTSYFGDSLNACRMSIYQLNKRLDKNYYTDIDPTIYYDESDLLAQKVYTAYDPTVSDSIRTADGPSLTVVLSDAVGQDAFDKYLTNPEYFKDADAFIDNIFRGIYVKCDYGDGTVLYVDQISLNLTFDCYELDSLGNVIKYYDTLEDSVFTRTAVFAATKEIIQANRFDNSDKLIEKSNEEDWTYIKSPAGIFTRISLPIQEIADALKNDTINAVSLAFNAYHQENIGDFAMSSPDRFLLIRENEVESFFSSNKIRDNITSYMYPELSNATGASTISYNFPNIVNLVNHCITEKNTAKKEAGSSWDEEEWIKETKWDKLLLIPIVASIGGTETAPQLISIRHDLRPTYVKLKGGKNNELELETHYTSFKN